MLILGVSVHVADLIFSASVGGATVDVAVSGALDAANAGGSGADTGDDATLAGCGTLSGATAEAADAGCSDVVSSDTAAALKRLSAPDVKMDIAATGKPLRMRSLAEKRILFIA